MDAGAVLPAHRECLRLRHSCAWCLPARTTAPSSRSARRSRGALGCGRRCACLVRGCRGPGAQGARLTRRTVAVRRIRCAALHRCRPVPWRRTRRHRGTGCRPHRWPSHWTDVDHGLGEVGVDFQSCNCVVKGDSGSARPMHFGRGSCFMLFRVGSSGSCRRRPLDAIARHDFRACDKSVCDGKTRRALLWLSVPFERGNHTRSNGGALRRGSRRSRLSRQTPRVSP